MSQASPLLDYVPQSRSPQALGIDVVLLTGGFDRPYAFGLAMELAAKGVNLVVIGGKEIDSPEMHATPGLNFLDLYGDPRRKASLAGRIWRVLQFYWRLFRYAASAQPPIFHILWNNKLQLFDRTAIMLYYRFLGKKVAFTAHNVNAGERDSKDSFLNVITLRIQYHLANHIFVHTEQMKQELIYKFGVRDEAVTVIPFGINNAVPNTALTPAEAKCRLAIGPREKTILFFGAIRPYKGLAYLVDGFLKAASRCREYRLVIAGEPKKDSERYLNDIQETIRRSAYREQISQRIEFIPDEQTELYFKAADVLVLPYTHIFQSGVLFLAYSFGLPVIASNVGSFPEDVVVGKTGFLFKACDADDLATTIERYFGSDLFMELEGRRQYIRDVARQDHSWDAVGELTKNVYLQLLGRNHDRTRDLESIEATPTSIF